MDQINYEQATHFNESDDPFIVIRKLFLDFGYTKFMKLLNKFSFALHSAALLMQAYFIINNFSLDLLIRYGCMMSVTVFLLADTFACMFLEQDIQNFKDEYFNTSWSVDSAGPKARERIAKWSMKISHFNFLVFTFFAFTSILILPLFGYHNEWILAIKVFEEYFGPWAKIPTLIFMVTFLFLIYNCVWLAYVFFYSILHVQIQILLVSEHISQISVDYDGIDEWTKVHDLNYQETMYRRLRFCIEHHVVLKKNIRTLLDIVQSVMVVLIFLGVICSVTLLNFILNCGEDASNILKVRLIFSILTAQLISFMYCAAGQLLIDGTEQVHMILMNCPWYIWNIKNRKALLIFMCNCLEPFKISLAGIALDHKLIPSTIKAAYSYATFLYNLKNSK